MSTKSAIGIVTKNLEFYAAYCHHGGNLEHNGLLLIDHYAHKSTVMNLINIGDIKILNKNLPSISKQPVDDVTLFYDNMRMCPRFFSSLESLVDYFTDIECEYIYLFDEKTNEWMVKQINNSPDWLCLEDVLKSSCFFESFLYNS